MEQSEQLVTGRSFQFQIQILNFPNVRFHGHHGSGPTPSRLFQQNPQSANKRKIFFFEEFTDFTLPYNMLLIMIDFNCSRKFIIQKLGARSFRISHSHLITIQSTINISNSQTFQNSGFLFLDI